LFHPSPNFFLLLHQVNDRIARPLVELCRVGLRQLAHIARKLNRSALHSKAYSKKRNPLLPGVADKGNLALYAPVAKAWSHKNAAHALKLPSEIIPFILRRLQPL